MDDGALVATDYRGRQHRFPLGQSEQAPALYRVNPAWWSFVDQHGDGIVQAVSLQWDPAEIKDLTDTAQIPWRIDDGPPPPLRSDGVLLQEPFVARHGVAFVAGASGCALAVAYLMPMWIAAIFFAVVLGVALYTWRAGSLAPPRRSKSTPQWEKEDAEREKELLEKYGPPWEPPVRGRWRLAVEWQFGIFFAAAVVLLVQGKYGPAAVVPLISGLLFFFTRYVFPGVGWSWWMFVVIGNIMGWVLFLAFLFGE